VAQALAYGADPNAIGPARMPPLFLAASRRNAEIVRALIKAGADVNVKWRGETLLDTVRSMPRGERSINVGIGFFDLVLRRKVRPEDDGIDELIKLLIDAGAK
jgi:ankyrin repeat protein